MTDLKIALHWTPNINYIGIFVAKELGFYESRKGSTFLRLVS